MSERPPCVSEAEPDADCGLLFCEKCGVRQVIDRPGFGQNLPALLFPGVPTQLSRVMDAQPDGAAYFLRLEWRRESRATFVQKLEAGKLLPAPVADPSETLALMAEYRLTVDPDDASGWWATPPGRFGAHGPTIGDAVRACVARIRGEK